MAERKVSSIIQYLAPLLADEVKLLKGVRKEIVSIKAELEHIHSFLEDAKSTAETGDKASQIQDIKNTIREIKEGADRYAFSTSSSTEHTSTNTNTKDNMWCEPRLASLFIGDDDVIGIESPKSKLISRLVDKNQSQRAVISLVRMGGIGKTTLAKKVYDNQEMAAHFKCKAGITISQSYKLEGLLKTMIEQLSGKDVLTLPDEGIDSLIAKARGYLYEKKYVVMFDDVWQIDFWGSIRHALPQNSKGSRVIITINSEQVAAFCKESSVDHVHELQVLSEEKAWELFCMKAFQLDFRDHCPLELEEISDEIIKKCKGLPLTIVAIGGLLSTKNKVISKWQKFYDSMGTELERNPKLTSIRKILLSSYNDLPQYLKSCFLYFGIMPENYSIEGERLIRLWITEGFVEEQKGKTLEEVAEEYLIELIHRRLVQVSRTKSDGRVEECRVHDVVREIIILMSEEFSFCQILEEENSSFNDTTHRISVHTHYCNMDKVMESIVGVKIQRGIGGLEELQNLWYVETNHGLIKENEKLRQLRKLGITKLEREHGRALCAAIKKMKYLQYLSVWTSSDDEILNLYYISSSSPPQYLQRLRLTGRLEKLPDWISTSPLDWTFREATRLDPETSKSSQIISSGFRFDQE
ncbi:hypothetical protein CsSME_00034399 [Camellia sinensis var. sinensis]